MRFPLPHRALAVALALATAASALAETLRIAGSDLIGSALRDHLAHSARAADQELEFTLRGSRLGLAAVREGRADAGLLVFAADDTRPDESMHTAVIGYLTCVVVVPESLSLTQINFEQLGGVFGASEQTNVRRWSEIGALGEWAGRSVSAMALSPRRSLAHDLFRYTVLKTPEFKPTVALLEKSEDAYARLRGEEGGVALLAAPPPENTGLKTLLVAKGPRDVAYGPTPENVHTGDYPLRVAVHLVFRKGDGARLRALHRSLLSEEAAAPLRDSGIVTLPVQARRQLGVELEAR